MPVGQPSPDSWARYKKAKSEQRPGDSSVPVNFRTFLGTFTGDNSPITENNFSQEDLQFLRNVYDNKKEANLKEEEMYRNIVNEYDNNPSSGLAYTLVDGKLADTSDQYIQDVRNKLDSYDRTRGKTSISYSDYNGNKVNEEAGLATQIGASFSNDPTYRIATTLGQFNVKEDADGNAYVEDTYDWSKPRGNIKLPRDFPTSLETAGNLAMRVVMPEVAREVKIKLPRKKLDGYYGKLRRPDGKVSTELSTTMEIDGTDVEMPLLVPTQKPEYIDIMLNTSPENLRKALPDEAYKIAQDHAIGRMKQKLNPFWQEGEEVLKYSKYDQSSVNTPKK